jgi:hypothetical protein
VTHMDQVLERALAPGQPVKNRNGSNAAPGEEEEEENRKIKNSKMAGR